MPNGIDSNASTKPATQLSPIVPANVPAPDVAGGDNAAGGVAPGTDARAGYLGSLGSLTFVPNLHAQCENLGVRADGNDPVGYRRPRDSREMFRTPATEGGGATATVAPAAGVPSVDPQPATDDALIAALYDPTLEANVETLRELQTKVQTDPAFRDACRDIHSAWRGLTSGDTWKAAAAGATSMAAAHAAAQLLLGMFQANPVMRVVAVTQPFVAMVFLQAYLKDKLGYVDPDPGNRAPASDNIRAANSLVNWNAVQPLLDNMLKNYPFAKPVVKFLVSGGLQGARNVAEHTQTAVGLGRLPDDAPAGPRKLSDFENAVVEAMSTAIRGMPDLHCQILKSVSADELKEIAKASSNPVHKRIVAALNSPRYLGGMAAMSAGYAGKLRAEVPNEAPPQRNWQPGPPRADEPPGRFDGHDPFDPFN